jgi:spore coat polysaccharide biosynthesis protein SpsF
MEDVVVLIQARAGSSRLPGKVLLPLGDRPVLAHVVERCRAAEVGPAVVATTALTADDAVAAAAREAGAAVFRGAADDVLGRFAAAAAIFPARHYVRITADCPFLDASVLAACVRAHVAGGFDFTYNDVISDFPRGSDVEVMTAALMFWLEKNRGDAASREHVTPFLYDQPGGWKIHRLPRPPGGFNWRGVRLSLDEEADYEFLQAVYARLGGRDGFGLADVGAVLTAEPALLDINRDVAQKGPPPKAR